MKVKKSAYFYLILTICMWSAVPAIAKLALKELDNLQILFYNNIVGIIALSIIILFYKKQKLFQKYKKIDFVKMFFMGFLGLYIYYILLYGSFAIAPAGQSNIINYLWPLFVVIFSIIILKEKFNYKTFIAIIVSLIGALLVFTKGDISNFNNEFSIGYLLAFFAAIAYGLFSVFGKKLHYEKYTSMLIYYISSLILITPTMFIFSKFVIPKSLITILALLFLGGLANSIGFVFWFKALKLGNTHKMANAVYINPFLSLVFVFFINGEVIPLISIIGLILIISGIFIQMKNKQ